LPGAGRRRCFSRIARLHLFELEDLAWYPAVVRDLATDYLHFMETTLALHLPVVPLLRDALRQAGTGEMVDLCSGGGGPMPSLLAALKREGVTARVTLTDKYPNVGAFRALAARDPDGIRFEEQPVDAAAVRARLAGFRTMFNAFHHFAPNGARAVLKSAVDARQPIGIFEIPERALATVIPLLFTPLFVWLATPFMRPLTWQRLLFTYLLPLVPLTCWWDGIVSQLRAYTVEELVALTDGIGGPAYQ